MIQGETGYHGGQKLPVILNLMCICFSILRDILKGIGYIRSGELGEKRVFKFSEREREKSRFRNSFKEKAEFDDRWSIKRFLFLNSQYFSNWHYQATDNYFHD